MPAGYVELVTERLDPQSHELKILVIAMLLAKALACCGCKGNRGDQLGIVAESHPLPGIRPGPVKHVLSVAMGLEISGDQSQQRFILRETDVCGLPAAVGSGASR